MELVHRIRRELSQFPNNKKTPNNRQFEQTLHKKEIGMENRHMKRCSTSLIIRNCKLKPQ